MILSLNTCQNIFITWLTNLNGTDSPYAKITSYFISSSLNFKVSISSFSFFTLSTSSVLASIPSSNSSILEFFLLFSLSISLFIMLISSNFGFNLLDLFLLMLFILSLIVARCLLFLLVYLLQLHLLLLQNLNYILLFLCSSNCYMNSTHLLP